MLLATLCTLFDACSSCRLSEFHQGLGRLSLGLASFGMISQQLPCDANMTRATMEKGKELTTFRDPGSLPNKS